MASAMDLSELEKDPRLFLYTSLTAGSSHIITATSRMETILKANKIPFQAIDTATDEKARRLWQRRAGKRKLPGLVKEGYVVGDLEEIEEWNEFGELKENIGPVPENNAPPPGGQVGISIAPPLSHRPTPVEGQPRFIPGGISRAPPPLLDDSKRRPMPGATSKAASAVPLEPTESVGTSTPAAEEDDVSATTKDVLKYHPALQHLSAPVSALQSGAVTPITEPVDTTSASSDVPDGGKMIKFVESQSQPEPTPSSLDTDEDSTAKATEALNLEEKPKTQDQSAADSEDAGKSVED